MIEKAYDIHERMYQFVVTVLKFVQKAPKTYINLQISGQLLRSVTSMGANDQEANGSSTKADFAHCYTIVRKEGNESRFWIRLLGDCSPSLKKEAVELEKEGEEIVRIISKIIYNTKHK